MTTVFKFLTVLLGVAIGAGVFSYPFVNQISAVENKREIKINNQIVIADAAATAAAREKGLSGRDSIKPNEGMFFVFDEPDKYGFWMKDMKFPIDIIWIRQNVIVGVEENVDPQIGAPASQLKIYYPPFPIERVLEVRAGRARTLQAKIGDKVFVRPLLPKASPTN